MLAKEVPYLVLTGGKKNFWLICTVREERKNATGYLIPTLRALFARIRASSPFLAMISRK